MSGPGGLPGSGDPSDDPLLPTRVARELADCRFGAPYHHRRTIGSTSDLALELGRDGAPEGTLVVADEQTAGRGRRRRRWVSPVACGIYASLLLRPRRPVAEAGAAVQLAAGVAIAEAVEDHVPVPVSLRWPNDCICGGRKLAGVLVEAGATGDRLDFLVCGIGINVNHEAGQFPGELAERATSLRMLAGHRFARLRILGDLVRALDRWDTAWRRHGLAPIRERWLELSPETRAGNVEVRTEAGLIRGRADGLGPSGELRVVADGELHEITVGEVVRLTPAR